MHHIDQQQQQRQPQQQHFCCAFFSHFFLAFECARLLSNEERRKTQKEETKNDIFAYNYSSEMRKCMQSFSYALHKFTNTCTQSMICMQSGFFFLSSLSWSNTTYGVVRVITNVRIIYIFLFVLLLQLYILLAIFKWLNFIVVDRFQMKWWKFPGALYLNRKIIFFFW